MEFLKGEKEKRIASDILKDFVDYISESGIQKTLKTTIGIRELIGLTNNQLSSSDIIWILMQLKKDACFSIENFEKLAYERKKIKNERDKKWELIIPLETKILKRRFKLLGSEFIFKSKKQALLKYKNIQFNKYPVDDAGIKNNLKSEYSTFLIIESKGTSPVDSWSSILEKIELFQGIFDFSLNYGFITYQFPFFNRQSLFQYSTTIYGISEHNEFQFAEFHKIPGVTKNINLQSKTVSIIRKKQLNYLIKFFNVLPQKNSIKDLVSYCFRLYGAAMNSKYLHDTFLIFWQIAETIALSDKVGGKTDVVISRIICHQEKSDYIGTSIEYTLKNLAKKRNDIVHRGLNAADQEDINILKAICEDAIFWIISISKQLTTVSQLEVFYKLRSASNKDINDHLTVINFLKNFR